MSRDDPAGAVRSPAWRCVAASACARTAPPPPDTPFVWRLPRGLPRPERPRRQPDVHRQGGARPTAVLRHATLRQRHVSPARAVTSRRTPSPTAAPTRSDRPARRTRAARCRSPTSPTTLRSAGRIPASRRSKRRCSCRCSTSTRSRWGWPDAGRDRRGGSTRAATVRWFEGAFPGDRHPVSLDNIIRAIAAFERTLLSADSPFDRYLYRDDRSAIPESAVRGMKLFFSERLGLQPVPCRLQPVRPGHVCERAAAAGHVLTTPASTIWTARARTPNGPGTDRTSPATPRTWAASGLRPCATWR